MWPDSETTRDLPNFSGVADTVAGIIVQARGRPLSTGVSEAWDTGKSSMIKLTRESPTWRPKLEASPSRYHYFGKLIQVPIFAEREEAATGAGPGLPPILEACLVVSEADPPQGGRRAAFLKEQ